MAVSFDKRRNRWIVSVYFMGEKFYVGSFKTYAQAQNAYVIRKIELIESLNKQSV